MTYPEASYIQDVHNSLEEWHQGAYFYEDVSMSFFLSLGHMKKKKNTEQALLFFLIFVLFVLVSFPNLTDIYFLESLCSYPMYTILILVVRVTTLKNKNMGVKF